MCKSSKKIDINQMLLKAHKLGVKKAIDVSARSNTYLVVYEGGKVKQVKPKYKYVRVDVKSSAKVSSTRSQASRRKKG